MNNDSQAEELRILGTAILKAVVIICTCVLVGLTINSCQLDPDTIANCNDACQSTDTQMESVTSYKCICTGKGTTTSPWVLN